MPGIETEAFAGCGPLYKRKECQQLNFTLRDPSLTPPFTRLFGEPASNSMTHSPTSDTMVYVDLGGGSSNLNLNFEFNVRLLLFEKVV